MEKIGIFGGSFDPVHNEHINLANQAIEKLGLDKLFILPAGEPPHKSGTYTGANHRLKMLELCFSRKGEKISIDSYEIINAGKSYSYLTVLHFKKLYNDASIFFIMGLDMLENFPNWKKPEVISENCILAAAGRSTQGEKSSQPGFEHAAKVIFDKYGKMPVYLGYEGAEVSSTELRFLLALESFKEASQLMPKEVISYIIKNALYEDNLVKEVKKRVSPKRFEHIKRVALFAISICHKFNAHIKQAFYAAVLHDIAKDQKECGGVDDDMPEPVRHAFAGAYILENELKIKDLEIIEAVKYHTTAKPDMGALSKLIFVCDMLEPARNYSDTDYLRSFLDKDGDECFKKCLESQYLHLKASGKKIYSLTVDAYNYYFKIKEN